MNIRSSEKKNIRMDENSMTKGFFVLLMLIASNVEVACNWAVEAGSRRPPRSNKLRTGVNIFLDGPMEKDDAAFQLPMHSSIQKVLIMISMRTATLIPIEGESVESCANVFKTR